MRDDIDKRLADVGELIKSQREVARMSVRRLADLAGVSNPYLSQIERGLRAPSERVVDAIARSLDMSASALYEQAGIPHSDPAEDSGARAAIEADEQLTVRQRNTLLEVYDNFVALNRRGN